MNAVESCRKVIYSAPVYHKETQNPAKIGRTRSWRGEIELPSAADAATVVKAVYRRTMQVSGPHSGGFWALTLATAANANNAVKTIFLNMIFVS